ncbi:MAG: site-2 protease family protein, partial [Anaerolineales bacterium]|nr:site-2 protease family protein [Anaerolineales bacterium]
MFNERHATTIPPEDVAELRAATAGIFYIAATAMDDPEPGHVRFRGYFLEDSATGFEKIYAAFTAKGYTPFLRPDHVLDDNRHVTLQAAPFLFDDKPSNWRTNLYLFLGTILTTLLVGYTIWLGEQSNPTWVWGEVWRGWPFSLSILLILGAHELGHYFAARYHGVPVSLPYFIPFPSIIGTMGAVIVQRAPAKNKRALFDVGAAGPLAGLVFAIPIVLIGLATSQVAPIPPIGMREGNSVIYALAKLLVFGELLPAGGRDVFINQLATAGWAGLLITGLNLLPVGQLDGGHITYVLFGEKANYFYWPALIGLAMLAFLIPDAAITWAIWIGLLFFFGRRHAVPLDTVTPLDPKRRALAIFT